MKQEKKFKARLALWTALLAAAAALALLVFSMAEKKRDPVWAGGFAVHISEVMTDNTTCPNDAGLLLDWVELENTSDSAFDLGGYALTDKPGEAKYVFPVGTKIPAHGFLVVWCSSEGEEGCAPFGLRREGGETVALLNANRVAIDRAETVKGAAGQSLVRAADGTLAPCDTPTPGYANDEEGARAWASVLAVRSGGSLELSEVMSSNSLYRNGEGVAADWVELYNPTDKPVALAGYKLSDREEKTKYDLPADRTLGPGEYLVVYCVPGEGRTDAAPFGLSSRGGETVVLTGSAGTVADSVTLPALERNTSYMKTAGEWSVSDAPTPGFSNDEAGLAAYRASLGMPEAKVIISELMPDNKACCVDADGDFSDWIELYNAGTESADLTGWYLSDQEEIPDRWAIPALTLAPGERVLIWASGKNRTEGELHTNFAVSAGEHVSLAAPNGVVVSVAVAETETEGASLVLAGENSYTLCEYPTPGYANDAEGYAAFCAADERTAPLLIREACPSDPDRADWAELQNVSGEEINLTAYSLTDRINDPGRQPLPEQTLAPGESVVVELTAFGLSAAGDELYLFSDGKACDWVRVKNVPSGGSIGRRDGENGFFLFTERTPGWDNGAGWRMVSGAPAADTPPGVYDGVDSLTVALSGEDIYYTTDGSVPTAQSERYTGPLTLTETTVLRAVCLPEGQLPGKSAVFSYFINENSSLPIVSLTADPEDLFGARGIYAKHEQAWTEGWEREANIAFFEEGGGFDIDCGIKIHGRTSRRASEKRSFTLKFRGRYDGTLNYDVFGDGAVTEFSSLLLRASLEDNYTSYMRDELFAALAMEYTDVPAQNYRYVSLYINGEYWGIYAIREHHTEEYFANHFGVDADTVDMQTGEFRGNTEWNNLMTYAEYNPGCWDYMKDRVDIERMIDWLILECWSGDIDVYENVRFYASPDYENGKYLYALADMDLTMMRHDTFTVGFNNIGQVHGIIPLALLSSPEFRDAFLTRLGELLQGGLSEESVNAKIAELRAIVEPESQRDLQRWGRDLSTFQSQMSNISVFVDGRTEEMTSGARAYFALTAEEMQKYFG